MNFFPIRLKGDKIIWIILLILTFASVLLVYSSTYQQTIKAGNLLDAITKHAVFLFVGLVIVYIIHLIPVTQYRKLAPIALVFSVMLLGLVFVSSGGRAPRWVLGGRFQPSDAARLIMIVYLAKVLSEGFKNKEEFIIKVLIPIGLVCGMIINGHTSAVVMIGLTSLMLIFMGTNNRKYLMITLLAVLLAGLLYFTLKDHLGRSETAESRVSTWWSNTFGKKTVADSTQKSIPRTEDIQAKTAKLAISSVGVLGKGPGNSKYRATLSEAHNDYIFAIIIEEYGLLGGLIIIALYLILFYRVILLIRRCDKVFPMLLLSGLILMIAIQAFIHIGVSAGGIPVTGQNLPMISKGGTSIITTSIAFGIILSISRAIEEKELKEKQNVTS